MASRWANNVQRIRSVLIGAVSAAPVAVFGWSNAVHAQSEVVSAAVGSGGSGASSSTGPYPISFTQYQANEELEDRFDVRLVHNRASSASGPAGTSSAGAGAVAAPAQGSSTLLATVCDGHGGFQAAEFCKHHLLGTVASELYHCTNQEDTEQVARALSRAFQRVDREFIARIRPAFSLGFGEVAHVGSCAIVAAVLPQAIVVANAGDCRAVFARIKSSQESTITPAASSVPSGNGSGSISGPVGGAQSVSSARLKDGRFVEAVALSDDHNARLPRERQRLEAEHPGEPDIVVCRPDSPSACYVKGRLQPTRAIGDAYLKHSEMNAPPGHSRTWGRHIRAPYTPPYITSSPELRALQVDHSNKDTESFLVLACDGVWDVLSNEEAAAFVANDILAGGSRGTVAERLRDHVLQRTAEEEGMSLAWIKGLKPGKGMGGRRNVHDDITVVVVFLGKKYQQGPAAASNSWKLW
jgi:pyruvate dehydrogenase phosphatase